MFTDGAFPQQGKALAQGLTASLASQTLQEKTRSTDRRLWSPADLGAQIQFLPNRSGVAFTALGLCVFMRSVTVTFRGVSLWLAQHLVPTGCLIHEKNPFSQSGTRGLGGQSLSWVYWHLTLSKECG